MTKEQDLFWQSEFQSENVKIKSVNLVYNGHFKIYSYKFTHQRFEGGWTPDLDREQVVRKDAVAVLLYDPKEDSIVLVEQLRMGALSQDPVQGDSPWMLEIPAGIIDEGETPIETAKREVLEETGCEIDDIKFIQTFYTTPGGFTEKISIYCAHVDSNTLGGIQGLPHEHEDIKVHVISYPRVNAFLEEGWVTSASTLIALQWLALHRKD